MTLERAISIRGGPAVMHARAQVVFRSYLNAWKERLLGSERGCRSRAPSNCRRSCAGAVVLDGEYSRARLCESSGFQKSLWKLLLVLVVKIEDVDYTLSLVEENDSSAQDHACPLMRKTRQSQLATLRQRTHTLLQAGRKCPVPLYVFLQTWRQAVTLCQSGG